MNAYRTVLIVLGIVVSLPLRAGAAAPATRPLEEVSAGEPARFTDPELAKRFAADKAKAESGDPAAMCRVGEALTFGDGVKPDPKQALEWFRKSATARHARAMHRLGELYMTGFAVERDLTQALAWYRRGAEAGDAAAMAGVGWMYFHGYAVKKDVEEAVRWYRKAADAGGPEGMNNLAHAYRFGYALEVDKKKALELFTRAAEKGNNPAMAALGQMYLTGEGVPKDIEKCREWYKRAAEAGHIGATCALAEMGLGAAGTEPDYATAAYWATRAAQEGHPFGMKVLGLLHLRGRGLPRDDAKGAAWMRKAAEAGDEDAMLALAELYRAGQGVERDEVMARKLTEQVADLKRMREPNQRASAGVTFDDPTGWRPVNAPLAVARFELGEGDSKAVLSVIKLPWSEEQLTNNVNRWRAQVGLKALAGTEAKKSLRPTEVAGRAGQVLDLSSPEDQPSRQRLIVVILKDGSDALFIRISGPVELVAGQKDQFDAFLRSVRFTAAAR